MTITIYSTSICAACETLTRWLDKQDIKYSKKITDENPTAMMEFMAVNDGLVGVPFSVITDDAGMVTKISGFDPAKFKQALAL